MATAIIAAMLFRGNFEYARKHLLEEGYIPGMLSKSRFNRRLHRIHELVKVGLFVLATSLNFLW